MRRWRTVATLLCAAVAVDCAEIPTEPRTTAPADPRPLLVPSTVLDTTIEAGDSVELRLVAQGPIVQRLFVWQQDAAAADSVSVTVSLAEPRVEIGAVAVAGDDPARRRWVVVPGMPTATELIVVVRNDDLGEPRSVSLSLEPPDLRPESADSVLIVGDTVTEAIDGVNDVDDFIVTGVAGKRLLLYVGKRGAVQPSALNFVVINPGGWSEYQSLQSAGNHTVDERAVPLDIPAGHTRTIRVSSDQFPPDAPVPPHLYFSNGEYLLRLVAVDSAPETAAGDAALGDTISDAVDFAGDIDEFRIPVVPGLRTIAVGIRLLDSVDVPVRVEVWSGWDLMGSFAVSSASTSFDDAMTRPFPVSTGNTVIRVLGGVEGLLERIVVPYELEIYEVNEAPESVPPALTLGATMVGEQLERLRDVDEFTLDLVGDSAYRVEMTGPVRGQLIHESSGNVWELTAHLDSSTGLRASAAMLPTASGPARLRIWADSDSTGPFTVTVLPVDPNPENANAVLTLNTLEVDAVDHAGDVDRYSLTVPTTDRYVGFMRRTLGPGVYADSIFLGPVPLNAGQTFALSVSSTTWPFVFGQSQQYELGAFRIDTLPEELPEEIAAGDTIVGLVDLRGDVDVYKLAFAGPSSKTFRINWLEAPTCDGYPSMTMHVSISGVWSWGVYSPSLWQNNLETFALSVPGTYSIRVASLYGGGGCHIPQYAFVIEDVTPTP